ncbi:MAG TPA: response regulator [Syntrophorhabdales bacterium]|nr:response regulator [Syntrophorhabdales bacterium]
MAKQQAMVYVIDDDESVRTALGRLLRSANFKAETFASADEFLTNPKQKQDSCILIDIRMPGSTGFDLQEKLASSGVTIPAIVVSASDDELIREHARQLGAVAFFRKPVDDQALLDAILWAIAGTRKNARRGADGPDSNQ